ncbi:MAG TPA: metal-sensitive transcriptional regulator [Candidatus Woesebacteria bacterium]|nr:metal-sensitive transcriptional regulator [Candidatus Woesebacteria bacterium]
MQQNKRGRTKQDHIASSLNRIRGQIDGIAKMYEEKRPCVEIARQLAAARNSISRVARDILTNEASVCSKEHNSAQLDLVLKELLRY